MTHNRPDDHDAIVDLAGDIEPLADRAVFLHAEHRFLDACARLGINKTDARLQLEIWGGLAERKGAEGYADFRAAVETFFAGKDGSEDAQAIVDAAWQEAVADQTGSRSTEQPLRILGIDTDAQRGLTAAELAAILGPVEPGASEAFTGEGGDAVSYDMKAAGTGNSSGQIFLEESRIEKDSE